MNYLVIICLWVVKIVCDKNGMGFTFKITSKVDGTVLTEEALNTK